MAKLATLSSRSTFVRARLQAALFHARKNRLEREQPPFKKPEDGFAYLVDYDGAHLVDTDGAYLITEID